MKSKQLKIIAVLVLAFGVVYGSKSASAHGPLDLEYIDAMLMHHRDGIKMSQMAEAKAHHGGIKGFAGKSIKEQEKGILDLEALRQKLYAGRRPSDGIAIKVDKRISVREMKEMAEADMRALEAALGEKFDETFLDIMTKHHNMAIDMSNEQISRGQSEELKTFSRKIIDAQKKGIGEMTALRKKTNSKNAKPDKH